MKKTVIMSIMMLEGTFAFANNGNGDTKNSETKPTDNQTIVTQTTEEKSNEEGLYCHVKDGNREASCWFCDCEKLAKALLDSGKKTSSSESN